MHASYQVIIWVLQLAYTTQACISNLKLIQCKQAHYYAHIKCNQSKVHELAPPTCVLLLSNNFDFDPSQFLNVAPSLSMSMSNLYFFVSISPKAFISLYNLSPFVINFHKRCASHWCKMLHWGRWLRLKSCIFMGISWLLEWHHL